MKESIFREKSLAKVQSPDNLNEYIQVSNPGIWILMVSIVFLLLGLCIWGCFGQLETTVQAQAVCENGLVTLTPQQTGVQPGMPVEIGGQRGWVGAQEADGRWRIETDTPLDDGVYEARIVVEQLHPVSFLLN